MKRFSTFCAFGLVLSWASSLQAGVVEVGPGDDVEGAINALLPGDELVLRGGTYTLTERFSFAIAGTESQPILIRAKDGEVPHLHRPTADQNIVDIDDAEHVVLRGIEFSGGSAGIRISGARDLTIEDCDIHDTADVAIRVNDGGVTYERLRVVGNHVHHTNGTGEGMYLGCNNDGCRLVDGIIERNYIHHTNQPGVAQGDGIELKEGSHGNIIRDNVIHDTNYPCILTYGVVGNGEPNVIERNVMWNCGDHAIQSAADAIIRNNIILGSNANGIAMQPHQSATPGNLVVVHNTVLHATNHAVSVNGNTGAVLIANNALYAQSGAAVAVSGGAPGMLTVVGNVGVGGVAGFAGGVADGDIMVDFVNAHYDGAPPIDVFPAPGGGLVAAGEPAHVAADDFNTTPRDGIADVGAYKFDPAGNPGWTIEPDFKEFPPDGGGETDGSTGGSTDGGTTDGGATDGSTSGGTGGADATAGSSSTGGRDTDSDGAGMDASAGGCGCRNTPGWTSSLALLVLPLVRRRSWFRAADRRRECVREWVTGR